MKLNKEQVNEIVKLRNEGKTQMELAFKFKVSLSTIQYWTNEERRNSVRKLSKTSSKRNYNKKTKKEKKELLESRREYHKNYHRNRYKTDEEFRKKQIDSVMKSKRKKNGKGINN